MSLRAGVLGFAFLLVGVGCAPLRTPTSESERQRQYDVSMQEGESFLSSHRYDLAAGAFETATRWKPDAAQAQALLGFCRLKEKQDEAAERALRRAVSLDPGHVAAWCNLGALEVRHRRYEEARACLERAVSLDPGFAPAQYSLGNLLMNLGDTLRGRQALERAFALDPSLIDLPSTSAVGFPEGVQTLTTCLIYARILATTGHTEGVVQYLEKARKLGFHDWPPLLSEADFDKVRDDPRIQHFLMAHPPHQPL